MAYSNSRSSDHSLAGHVTRVFVAVGALIVLTLVVAGGCFVGILAHYEPTINDLVNGRSAVRLAHEGMLDQETGLRGYLSTGNRSFLEPYVTGQDELSRGNAGTATVGSRSDMAGLLLDMRTAQQVWVTSWAIEAAARQPGLSGGASLDTFVQSGKALFDNYRLTETALADGLSAEIGNQQAAERTTMTIGLGLVVAVFLVAMVVAIRLHRAARCRGHADHGPSGHDGPDRRWRLRRAAQAWRRAA